jgi:epoxyqueuosine reductase
MTDLIASTDTSELLTTLRRWATELGFQQLGISGIELEQHEQWLQQWLAAGYQGEMQWMGQHGNKRSRPEELVPGTVRVLSLRMDYFGEEHVRLQGDGGESNLALQVLADPNRAYISRYTLGRDYHKLVRKRLATLGRQIEALAGGGRYRAFVDSAPVLERALAEQAGLGWIAKNTMLINPEAGSWFFLGEIYTDLPLPVDEPQQDKHCGTCTACLDICPTGAFFGPYQLDARRCISYLTIELDGPIPEDLRPLMGNRVFGCDDCQLVCPWNKFAQPTAEADFKPRHQLDDIALVELFSWDEETWLSRTEGSALRRIGHARWLRNLAVALGNAPTSEAVLAALASRRQHPSALVREHVSWALGQHPKP